MTKNKIISFEILRIFALLLVFISHLNELVHFSNGITLTYLGCAGVSLFIALSGYLAIFTNTNNAQLSFFSFFKKRLKQFYLLHIITLLIAIPLSIDSLVINPINWIITLVANLTLTQSFFPYFSIYFSFNGVSWYLSLMLYLALLTPITLKIWSRLSLKTSLIIMAVIAVIEFILVFLFELSGYVQWIAYIFPVIRYLDFFCGGAIYHLAIYIRDKKLYTLNKVICCSSIVLTAIFALISIFSGNKYYLSAVWFLPSQMLVMSIANIRVKFNSETLIFKGIIAFTSISLEFIMIHQLVIKYYLWFIEDNKFPIIIVSIIVFIISIVGAILMHQVIRRLKLVELKKLSILNRR